MPIGGGKKFDWSEYPSENDQPSAKKVNIKVPKKGKDKYKNNTNN